MFPSYLNNVVVSLFDSVQGTKLNNLVEWNVTYVFHIEQHIKLKLLLLKRRQTAKNFQPDTWRTSLFDEVWTMRRFYPTKLWMPLFLSQKREELGTFYKPGSIAALPSWCYALKKISHISIKPTISPGSCQIHPHG